MMLVLWVWDQILRCTGLELHDFPQREDTHIMSSVQTARTSIVVLPLGQSICGKKAFVRDITELGAE